MEEFGYLENKGDLRVLMLGGRRCGKTALLASMFESIVNGIAKNYFKLADATTLKTKGIEIQDSLNGKTAELKDLLAKSSTSTFLVDQQPTNQWWDYRLKIKIGDREMFINFRDVPGEFCRKGNEHETEVAEYVSQCDVFVIAIDTPYLMESAKPNNRLCNDGINDVVNRVPDIQQYLTCIKDNEGKDSKMVIFCPVKCEKWFKEGRIDEVNERLLQVYDTCITNLKGYQKMDISIIPVLTAGNIEFVEQKEAFVLMPKSGIGKPKRCCQQSSKFLRLADGSQYMIKEGDIVNEDNDAVISGTTLVRPYSWFKILFNIDKNKDGYKPVNCEQIPLHIIRFMLVKRENEKRFWEKVKTWFGTVFGTIDPDELKNIIIEMQKAGVIKDNEDGIVHVKKAY
jgi:hypothetical protein